MIPGSNRGVPILLLFSCQCGHCPFLFGGGGGGGVVGGRVGIIYFNCLGYVYVYVRCLGYVCVLCLCLSLCSYFHSFHLGLCVRMSQFNFMF